MRKIKFRALRFNDECKWEIVGFYDALDLVYGKATGSGFLFV